MSETLEAELHPTLDPIVLNTAISSLSPALEILERFHHRNKNQHRLSKWWAQADMLRRHTRKMLLCLDSGVEEAERLARIKAKKKMKTRREAGGDAEHENKEARKRAEYLRWKLGPGAYLAFTQLSADRQFAHLGLMLLGVLAQIDGALIPFTPSPRGAAAKTPAQTTTAPTSLRAGQLNPIPFHSKADSPSSENAVLHRDLDPDGDADMGVAVSRDDVILQSIEQAATARSISAPVLAQSQTQSPAPDLAKATNASREPATPHPRSGTESELPLPKPTTSTAETETGSGIPGLAGGRKPKKKKAPTGDEFDDIFGSLDKDKGKKPKKKKRKKGDEFDDIFGGLL
ncbi:hypothetical protein MFIFM68171_10971 [Madurella fahalii]|uniref:RNase MRP protein 1 RNA binding domain-containing protein n=1 Tax=Madurella fahalii TaxID=1157608 RepID=A0ABQ0GSP6_9PEZI